MLFFTGFMSGILRSNITLVLEAMVLQPTTKLVPHCLEKYHKSEWMDVEVPDYGPRYNWSRSIVWHITTTYYYGSSLGGLSSGLLVEIFGPKHTVLWSLVASSILNALIPHGAAFHWMVPLTCRFCGGLAAGIIYPSMMCLITRWSPPHERGKFLSAMVGHLVGVAAMWTFLNYTMPLTGWQSTFYTMTALVTVYCVAFFLLVADSPEESNLITQEELEHIKKSQGHLISIKKQLPPYKKILTSSSIWALVILNFGYKWCNQINVVLAPRFIRDFIGVTTRQSVLLIIVPQIFEYCGSVLFGNMSDIIQATNTMSVNVMTKIFVVVSHLLPGIIIMSIGIAQCSLAASTIMTIIISFMAGACVVTNFRNPLDLAPNHAASIYGINIFVGSTSGVLLPLLFSLLLSSTHAVLQWSIMFLLTGLVLIATGLIFLFFGTSELQYWNVKLGRGTRLGRTNDV
ncbi:sodium-dependent phosphate transport protein 1-like [Rhynchophorus ferrugineus]|uniref:sodium-dependent phosphate transport protein 1-like n=1 Tax=Rhynchophorus ferrugineus TaxID=354439 RepID=UPI003FCCEAEA